MKIFLNFILCTAFLFAVISCNNSDEEKPSQEQQDREAIIEIPDSVKQKIEAQDSIMAALAHKVDTLIIEINSSKKENVELKERLEDLENTKNRWGYMTIIAMVLSILAIIRTIIRKYVTEEQVDEKIRSASKEIIKGLKNIEKLQSDIKSINRKNNQFETDISNIKSTLNHINNSILQDANLTSIRPPHEPVYPKVGYAKKEDNNKFFTKIYDTKQEGCVFEITFTSQDQGSFNIISLDKIQSRNDWQEKIECSGISIREASKFSVEEKGICKKCDENTWEVTKPLKIKLS